MGRVLAAPDRFELGQRLGLDIKENAVFWVVVQDQFHDLFRSSGVPVLPCDGW
jgi:hypothetical protein